MTTYQLVSGLSGIVDWSDPNIWVGGIVPDGADASSVMLEDPGAGSGGVLQVGNSNLAGDTIGSLDVGTGVDLASFAAGGGPLTVYGPTTIEGSLYLGTGMSLLSGISISTTGQLELAANSFSGPVDNDGTITTIPADFDFTLARAVTGTGTIVLSGAYNEESGANFIPFEGSLTLGGADTNNVAFSVPMGALTLDDPSSFTGTISGFAGAVDIHYDPSTPYNDTRVAPGNEIVLEGIQAASIAGDRYDSNGDGGVLTLDETDGATLALKFAGQYDLADFALAATADGTGTIVTDTVVDTAPCFAAGTRIATPSGPVSVEDLAVGGLVLLEDGTQSAIRWIGHRRQQDGVVVRVCAHALGRDMPARDLIVSSDHGLHVQGVLVQASLLVDDDAIRLERRREVTFWHVELERHAILLAEGAPAESFLDTGNRRRFANCALGYDPVHDAAAAEPCAEMVFAGERLERIRRAVSLV